MNTVAYEFKRVHWSMTTKAMNEFKRLVKVEKVMDLKHMTPARFDMLTIIAEYWWWNRKPGWRPRPQAEVPMGHFIELLGLHPSTISRMLQRMQKRELIVTYRNPLDERYLLVRMTEAGWRALKAARRVMRRRPRNFLRVELANWFAELGMPDSVTSIRTVQRWGKRLASRMGFESSPIHDPRYDHGRAEACRWQLYYDFDEERTRLPRLRVRRRSYG